MSNYLFTIWIILSAGLLLLFFYAAFVNLRRRRQPEVDLGGVIPFLLPVDVDALSQLIDPQHEAYTRHTCSKQDFQKLRRKQARLTVEYLRRMSHNAALLQRVGYSQIHSANSLVASQAQELIDAGVHVRLYTFVGLAVLFLWRFLGLYAVSFLSLPKVSDIRELMSSSLIPAYEQLRNKAESLTTLRDTDFREALVQSL
jgi:hypothetical protein